MPLTRSRKVPTRTPTKQSILFAGRYFFNLPCNYCYHVFYKLNVYKYTHPAFWPNKVDPAYRNNQAHAHCLLKTNRKLFNLLRWLTKYFQIHFTAVNTIMFFLISVLLINYLLRNLCAPKHYTAKHSEPDIRNSQ